MSKAESGRLGGLVKAPRPDDLLNGNPDARRLANRIGQRRKGRPSVVIEFYGRDPSACILLTEKYLSLLGSREAQLLTKTRLAERAAYETIRELRQIGWCDLQPASSGFLQWMREFEIGLAALTLIEIVEASRKDGQAKE